MSIHLTQKSLILSDRHAICYNDGENGNFYTVFFITIHKNNYQSPRQSLYIRASGRCRRQALKIFATGGLAVKFK
jgi:hypothetical protein